MLFGFYGIALFLVLRVQWLSAHGTGTSIVLLATAVRPSSVSINVPETSGSSSRCSSSSALFQAASRAEDILHAARVSSRRDTGGSASPRSEERRVGKECRSRWS